MKTLKSILFIILITQITVQTFAQNITADTTLANEYYELAKQFRKNHITDSALFYVEKAQELYIKNLEENSLKNAVCLNLSGGIFKDKSEYDKALKHYFKSLEIFIELLGEKHTLVAMIYNNIGIVYKAKSEYDLALEYQQKALDIRLQLPDKKYTDVATSYNNIGNVYRNKSEYDMALEYHQKALGIRLQLLGEKHNDVAMSYNNIGNVYWNKSEYDKALEYFFKSLEIWLELLGEKHTRVAVSYINIGAVYNDKSEYDKALEYYFKSLKIRKELLGEKHTMVAASYNNIGIVYRNMSEYDKTYPEKRADLLDSALEYHFKGLKIKLELLGEKHTDVASSYNNIGVVYEDKSKYNKVYPEKRAGLLDSALEYYFKCLKIRKELLGEKHTDVAASYNNIGNVYQSKSEYDKALEYYQKGAASCLRNFNAPINVSAVPEIKDYLDWYYLLQALQEKARIFADTTKYVQTLPARSQQERIEIALRHDQACDTLISSVRKDITTQSDKLALGEKASEVYMAAVDVCIQLSNTFKVSDSYYNKLAFYFSERNKSSVLLEALAGSDALQFAGIPQNLLDKEHKLSIDIANYINLKNNAETDSIRGVWESRLFNANRSYDSLIVVFETEYPKYYELKYNNKPATVPEIQKLLDKKTAMLSYFVLDSAVIVYVITKKGFEVYKTAKIDSLDTKIENYRAVMQSNETKDILRYGNLAFELYEQFFPAEILKNKHFAKIENLIVLPDGVMASIPLETLFTEKYNAQWTGWKNTAYFSEMPFLIKKYNISYSYSATLFKNTFPKEKQSDIELTNLNEWLAFAPVFDDNDTNGTCAVSRKLLIDLEKDKNENAIVKRSYLRDGSYVSPLPGTLDEVNDIFKLFDKSGKQSKYYTKSNANEETVKSGELAKYRILHFATHGFVNTEKPELSGILLAQDTTFKFTSYEDIYGNIAQQNDGILYQSEIYNLELNADLVVLSACETGLGKITSGEGVIGLTRALLYAGTKNIIVSLWQVSDASTSQLMINFYKNYLKAKKPVRVLNSVRVSNPDGLGFSQHLRQAKLKLISEGKYAHPFFWSPFILVGK